MSKFINGNSPSLSAEENLNKLQTIAGRLKTDSLDPTSLLFALAGSKAFEESVEWTKNLLEAGAQIEISSEKDSLSQLSMACVRGNFKVAKVLLEEVLKDDALAAKIIPAISDDKDRPTLLHYCAATNAEKNPDLPEFLDLLLQSEKANINAQDSMGYSPLMISTLWRNQPAASLFLKHGARLNLLSSYGRSAEAFAEEHNDGFVEIIREERARRNNMVPQVAQELGCSYSHRNPGIDDDVNNKAHGGLLHYACQHSNAKAVKKLIGMDANIESIDKFGFTPVFKTCLKGNIEAFEILVNNGANLKAASFANENMLHVISRMVFKSTINPDQLAGVLKITEHLVEAGVDINAPNSRGVTPRQLARHSFKEVSEILEKKALYNALLQQQEQQKIALSLPQQNTSSSHHRQPIVVELQEEHTPIPATRSLPKKNRNPISPIPKPAQSEDNTVPNPTMVVASQQGAQLLKTDGQKSRDLV